MPSNYMKLPPSDSMSMFSSNHMLPSFNAPQAPNYSHVSAWQAEKQWYIKRMQSLLKPSSFQTMRNQAMESPLAIPRKNPMTNIKFLFWFNFSYYFHFFPFFFLPFYTFFSYFNNYFQSWLTFKLKIIIFSVFIRLIENFVHFYKFS